MSTLDAILNYIPISDRIATAGQPTPEQFEAIRAAGYKVVINLAMPTSTNALPNESQIVESLGMDYIPMPVEWEHPTQTDVEQFFSVMQAHVAQPVFVHCAMNMRVSAFMYLYRQLYQQVDEPTARRDMERIWQPNPTWQSLIDHVLVLRVQ